TKCPCLARCGTRAVLLEQLDHPIKIGIASTKAPCEQVPTTHGNPLAVREHVELTGLTRRKDGVNSQAVLDEGHETRDLDAIILSSGVVNDFDLHSFLGSSCCGHLASQAVCRVKRVVSIVI